MVNASPAPSPSLTRCSNDKAEVQRFTELTVSQELPYSYSKGSQARN